MSLPISLLNPLIFKSSIRVWKVEIVFSAFLVFFLKYYISLIAVMKILQLIEMSAAQATKFTLQATVASGLEAVTATEFNELYSSDYTITRGRVFANVWRNEIPQVLRMRSIDNVSVVADIIKDVSFTEASKAQDLKKLEKLAYAVYWDKALMIWKKITDFQGIIYPTKEEYTASFVEEQVLKEKLKSILQKHSETSGLQMENGDFYTKEEKPLSTNKLYEKRAAELMLYKKLDTRDPATKAVKFRVTCYHTGEHSFGSQEAATAFGGALQDIFHWVVDLTYYDLEIVINIKDDLIIVTLPLTKESMHRRTISHFGPTTLRSTICYCMLKLASPKAGDVIVDPLCGGGSIPIEGALSFPTSFFLCGDMHLKAVERTLLNIQDYTGKKVTNIDVFNWDAQKLPFKDMSVDICVTDLPFGKRLGSRRNNSSLYLLVLTEIARIMKTESGRGVFLTHDKRNFARALALTYGLWKLKKALTVNIGGLSARLYVIYRTDKQYTETDTVQAMKKRKKHYKV